MIKKQPVAERPRERCLSAGPDNLSLRECIAVILGTGPRGRGCLGLAQDILDALGSGPELSQSDAFFAAVEARDWAAVSHRPGIGQAGLTRMMAACELGRRYALYCTRRNQQETTSPTKTLQPADAALKIIPPSYRASPHEWIGFVPVNGQGKLGSFCLVEKGCRSHVNFSTQELFARLLVFRPYGFYLFHNHPSGNCRPSRSDLDLTDQVFRLAQELDCLLLGHWVVASTNQHMITC